MSNAVIREIEDYRCFTKPAELHKAVNTLHGLVGGMTMEDGVSDAEMKELVSWCNAHCHLKEKHPFHDLLSLIEEMQKSRSQRSERAMDILWMCENILSENSYYDDITSALQYLAGLLHGVLADNELSNKEILVLRDWLDAHDFLIGYYPFDEIESLLNSVLSDGKVEEKERLALEAFFSNFIDLKSSCNLNEIAFKKLRQEFHVDGICADSPHIQIPGSTFCFTGRSSKATEQQFADIVTQNGGNYSSQVTNDVNYLIVGTAGAPCWAYACYGRKIEQAVTLRQQGSRIIIVNENDFWDCI